MKAKSKPPEPTPALGTETSGHRDRPGSLPDWAGVSIFAIPLALAALFVTTEILRFGHLALPLDDAYIHLQFARQLAAGDGLAYNPGAPPVTGSTAPLWTALLAAVSILPGSAVAWAKLLGVALLVLTARATQRLGHELGLSPRVAWLAALVTGTSPWLVWSALSGMEILLFAALSSWGLVLACRERRQPERPPLAVPIFGLATLARPEGALLVAISVLDELVRPGDTAVVDRLRRLGAGLALATVAILPTVAVYLAIGGSPLPTTFDVKAGGGIGWPDSRYLRIVVDVFFRSQPLLLFTAGAGALVLVARRRRGGWLVAGWLIGLPVAYSLLAGGPGPPPVGNFGRYYFPLLPILVLLGLLGATTALGQRRRTSFALATVLLLVQGAGLITGQQRYLQTLADVEASDVAAAHWLAERLPPSAAVAAQDAGAIKYLLPDHPLIDLAGLVTPEILPHLRPSDDTYWERSLLDFLAERRPAVLVVFPEHYPMLTRQVPGFVPIARFPVPGNITMAGDELVVMATPWAPEQLREAGP